MTQAEIKKLLKQPEGRTLEFKRDLSSLLPDPVRQECLTYFDSACSLHQIGDGSRQ